MPRDPVHNRRRRAARPGGRRAGSRVLRVELRRGVFSVRRAGIRTEPDRPVRAPGKRAVFLCETPLRTAVLHPVHQCIPHGRRMASVCAGRPGLSAQRCRAHGGHSRRARKIRLGLQRGRAAVLSVRRRAIPPDAGQTSRSVRQNQGGTLFHQQQPVRCTRGEGDGCPRRRRGIRAEIPREVSVSVRAEVRALRTGESGYLPLRRP